MLFDKICRKNGITHRLTAPATPSQNGKVERFHGTFRPEFLDKAGPFTSVARAQAAVDAWVDEYNSDRPHQALDDTTPVTPAERFAPIPDAQRDLIGLWRPPNLESVATTAPAPPCSATPAAPVLGGAIEFDRTVPASGNLWVADRQFWLGPVRAGQTVRFWADTDLIHLSIAGVRVKTLRSHLSINDLARLRAQGGAVAAAAAPLPGPDASGAIEVDRTISACGAVSLAGRQLVIAEILAARRVSIRIEPAVLMVFDPDTRELLRTRPNPLSSTETRTLRGARPAGPPPRPSIEPIRVQRRASTTGLIMIAGQKIALGRAHRHQTLTVTVSDTTLAIELEDGETRTVRRTSTQPVRSIKGQRPRTATVS